MTPETPRTGCLGAFGCACAACFFGLAIVGVLALLPGLVRP